MGEKIEKFEIDFKRVNVENALKLQSAFFMLAMPDSTMEAKTQANLIMAHMAVKHLVLTNMETGQKLENLMEENLDGLFENEFAILEITALFQKRIGGFIQKLPSFQNSKTMKAGNLENI